jgi:hypothetical protein
VCQSTSVSWINNYSNPMCFVFELEFFSVRCVE